MSSPRELLERYLRPTRGDIDAAMTLADRHADDPIAAWRALRSLAPSVDSWRFEHLDGVVRDHPETPWDGVVFAADPAGVARVHAAAARLPSALAAWGAEVAASVVWAVWPEDAWDPPDEARLAPLHWPLEVLHGVGLEREMDSIEHPDLRSTDRPLTVLEHLAAARLHEAVKEHGTPIPIERVESDDSCVVPERLVGVDLRALPNVFEPAREVWSNGYGLDRIDAEGVVVMVPAIPF